MAKCNQCEKDAVFYYDKVGLYLCVEHNLALQQAVQLQQNSLANMINYLRTEGLISMGFLPPFVPNNIAAPSPFPGDTMTFNNFQIDHSTIGAINTGNIQRLDVAIDSIRSTEAELAPLLKELTEAVIKDQALDNPTRNQILEYVSFLATQVASPKENRNPNIANSVLDIAQKTITSAAGLVTIWVKVEPLLRAALALQP